MKRRIAAALLFIILLAAGYAAWQLFGPTVSAPQGKYFYVKTGAVYADVKQNLQDEKIIHNNFFFDFLAKRFKYPSLIKAGRYKINPGMSLFNLVRMLRSGRQSPVNLVINKLRTKEDLAQKIASNFECDSLSIMNVLNDPKTWQQFNVDSNTIITLVIPNTYSFYWNTPAAKIIKKLYDEKIKFWTANRLSKAKVIGLTPVQVYSMASIVEEETNKEDDKGKIASVYMNRIATGMKLQADPTVKFAMKDFKLTRILYSHLNFSSPFNTYVISGLPPGPICTPSVKTIDAVLNAPKTNYLYFVAKPSFDGYSNFASTYAEHQVNAKAYQQALDSLIKSKANK